MDTISVTQGGPFGHPKVTPRHVGPAPAAERAS